MADIIPGVGSGGVDISGIGSTALFVAIMVIVFIFLVGAIIGLMFVLSRWKRYQEYKCIIFEHDGLNMLRSYTDKAGVFVDGKTNNKRFFLKKAKVGLSPDNIPYIPMGMDKVVYLYRYGLKNFRYVKMAISDTGFNIIVGEEDVNWGLNTYEAHKKRFSQSMLMAILPYAALIFVSIIILLMFIYLFKEFPVIRDASIAFRDAAVAFAQSQGTTVITGGT